MVIVDPGISRNDSYKPYTEGLQKDVFIKVHQFIYIVFKMDMHFGYVLDHTIPDMHESLYIIATGCFFRII